MWTFLETVRDHYFDFQGRTDRGDYWTFFLIYVFFSVALGAFGEYVGKEGAILHGLFFLAMALPNVGAAVRRLHDTDRTGWWFCLLVIPVVGAIALLVLLLLDGTHGPNEYGPDPLGRIE